jgi:hypothetical protein
MSVIDYSKWDNLCEYSDDDDDDEEEAQPQSKQPRVTRLDQPSRVTVQQGEISVVHQQEQQDDTALKKVNAKATESAETESAAIPASWTEKGGAAILQGSQLYWSQDRYSATLRVALSQQNTKGIVCKVSNLLPYKERFTGTSQEHCSHLVIIGEDEELSAALIESDVAYPVHKTEEEEGVDWSIETHHSVKYLAAILYKATPMEGLTLWWKRPLVDLEEIQLDWVQKDNAFSQAWEQAHQTFLENAATREPTILPF